MKKIVLLIIAAACVYGGLLMAQEHKGPRINAAEMRYDFGTVAQGAQPSHVFSVKNVGTEELEIEHVKTS